LGDKTFLKVYKVSLGIIIVEFTTEFVVRVTLSEYEVYPFKTTKSSPKPNFLDLIDGYLSGQSVELSSIPVSYGNLPNNYINVYEYMRKHIGYGETTTYGRLGGALKMHPRTVGMILSKNPLPLLVPCHRVLAKGGLGGYSAGLKWKKFLLSLEGTLIDTRSFKKPS